MKSSIALIGFMGVGKTAVGRVLARKLKRKFVELDSLIERRAGKSIPEIFREEGEVAFRKLEIEVTEAVSRNGNQVIAAGGGVVLNKINIDRLKEDSLIVYLTAPPKVILKRIEAGGERPLLEVTNPTLTIQELLSFRKPFYERAADIKIDTSRLDIDSVVDEIIAKVRQDASFAL
ncbi:MAG: shikimate kinase [Dehalococcoidia bacterium]|nr:MAG: shikimate kinase [Dehalococcoidia bacterium]